jgi:hypothetical protein
MRKYLWTTSKMKTSQIKFIQLILARSLGSAVDNFFPSPHLFTIICMRSPQFNFNRALPAGARKSSTWHALPKNAQLVTFCAALPCAEFGENQTPYTTPWLSKIE